MSMPSTMATSQPGRPSTSNILMQNRIDAVLWVSLAREYRPSVQAIVDDGVVSMELAFNTEGVMQRLPELRAEFGAAWKSGSAHLQRSSRRMLPWMWEPITSSRPQPVQRSSTRQEDDEAFAFSPRLNANHHLPLGAVSRTPPAWEMTVFRQL